jgi:ATP-binding cassette subfamily B protein
MKNIGKIITLSKPLYKKLLGLSFLVLLMSALQQVQPFFVKFIVDDIQKQITTGGGEVGRITYLMGGMLIVNLVSNLLNSLNMRFGDYINSRLGKFLTEKFYAKVFTLPQKYFDSEISGKILNQLNRGILSIQDFVGMSTNFVLPAVFQSVFTIGILMYYDTVIGIICLMIFPIYIAVSHYATKQWGRLEIKKNALEDVSRGRIQEVIANIRLVRGFSTQKKEWSFVSKTLFKLNKIYDKQSTTYHIINFFRGFGLEAILIGIFLIVFRKTFLGVITLGEMILIIQLLGLMRRPLHAMSFILERIQRAESGSKEYFEIMDLESVEKMRMKSWGKNHKQKSIGVSFKNVSFSYEDKKEKALENVSFELKKNETVALVGHSGAGKSTIINLILKYYQPTKGKIYLGNKPYDQLTHEQIRSNISLVFQDNELFSTTVRENVAYGIENPEEKDIVSALKKANAYDFVMKFPKKLDAQIGERGVKLSGGQKQRIQIARAIMHDSPILILDEATSSLDSKSEKSIQDALEQLMKDRLVIIIAHRFSTIQSASKILVIDDGKLVDMGNPNELANKEGVYKELLSYQIRGNQKLLEKYDLR